jgi:predicted lipid-binding transport protein (Tim44 family)
MAAILIGADDAEVGLAEGWGFVASSGGAFTSLVTVAAAEEAVTRQGPTAPTMSQSGSQTYPGGSLTDLFRSGGLLGGFAAGFLGSGVLGLLFGRGMFGELDGAASYCGLLCQLALLMALCWLIWTRWYNSDVAEAGARSSRQLADPYLRSRGDLHFDADASAGTNAAFETEERVSSGSVVTKAGSERD